MRLLIEDTAVKEERTSQDGVLKIEGKGKEGVARIEETNSIHQ